jgi:3D (Asp-Asp-Asp) domain-containing protein
LRSPGECACRRLWPLVALLLLSSIATAEEQALAVTATAYNSTQAQTDARPNKGAWGDPIEPGMKIIAVSPDLVRKGLVRGTKVRIEGMAGEWTVLDRTPSRHRNRIDLYMGVDVSAARNWGRRRVTVRWDPSEATTRR